MSRKAIFKALFAVTAWRASFVATKISLQYVFPISVVWLRFGMGVCIPSLAVGMGKQFSFPRGKDWGYFAILGFLGVTFHQWLQSTELITAQATTTAWIIASTPIFMALLGLIILHERLAWYQVAGIFLAAFGVLLVVAKGNLATVTTGKFGEPGDFLVLLSAPNWAVFSALSWRGLATHPATRMMFYVMTLGRLFTNVLFFAGPGPGEFPQLTLNGWMGVAFLGIFCSGLAYIVWYDAPKALPAAQLGTFLYLELPVTVVVAAVILAESITWAALSGGAIILFGVWLVNRRQN